MEFKDVIMDSGRPVVRIQPDGGKGYFKAPTRYVIDHATQIELTGIPEGIIELMQAGETRLLDRYVLLAPDSADTPDSPKDYLVSDDIVAWMPRDDGISSSIDSFQELPERRREHLDAA